MAKIDEHIKVMMLKGETGSSIKSIDKTATHGLVDTYTVTLTDGRKSNFNVTNGKDGADFDTFEIGGRNLYTGTRDFSGANWINCRGWNIEQETYLGFAVLSRSDNWFGVRQRIAVKNGESYVFSGYYKAEAGSKVYVYFDEDSDTAMPKGKTLASVSDDATSWTRFSVQTKIIADGTIAPRVENSVAGKKLYVCGLKLERGTKPSDWTPAPEDKADVSALAGKADVSTIVRTELVESTAMASQAYAAGDYVVVNGVLRKVKSAIAKGNTISDSNSTVTTVIGELATVSQTEGWFVFDIGGVKLAIKTITESVSVAKPYTSDVYYGNVPAASLPSGVFANAPACSASIVNASATCWIASLSGSAPTKAKTQQFRILSSSNETINVSIMITAIGA